MKKIIITVLVSALPMFSQILQTEVLQNQKSFNSKSLLNLQIEKVGQLQFNVYELIDSVVINGGKGTHSYLYDNQNRVTDYTFISDQLNGHMDTLISKYSRDSNGYLTRILTENNNNWNTYKFYYYDENYRIISIVDSSRVEWTKTKYEYNSDGTKKYYSFDILENKFGDENPSWTNIFSLDKQYSYENKMVTYVLISASTNRRMFSEQMRYYYNDDLKLKLFTHTFNSGMPTPKERKTKYFYNNKGLLEIETIESVDYAFPETTTKSKKVYTYYADYKLQSVTSFKFNTGDSSYVPLERTSYKYNSFDKETNIHVAIFDNEWRNSELTEYSYDEMGKCIHGANYYWLNENWNSGMSALGFSDSKGKRHLFHNCSEFEVYYRDSKIINYKLGIESELDTTVHYLTSGSINEGSSYYLDSLKLSEPFNNYEKQFNVFQGTRFSIDHGAINENISLDIRFMGITPNGITNPIDNTPLFMFLGIEVSGENSGVTSFEDFYYFGGEKKARIFIPMSERYFEMMEELDIDTSEISFAYIKGGEYFTEGIEWEIKQGLESKPDSLCVYLDHFSKIVGGKNFITSIESELNQLPTLFRLEQNYPNPFNPETTIQYSIPTTIIPSGVEGGLVELIIYDVLGREVKTIVSKYQNPGNYEVNFNASNLASGIYYYQLKTGSYVETKKMILMK